MDKIQIICVVGVMLVFFSSAWASSRNSWQLDRLIQPQGYHINQEKKGAVFIYDGLYDTDIEIALDQQFHRIDHMMFIRTKVIEDGEVSENNDCD